MLLHSMNCKNIAEDAEPIAKPFFVVTMIVKLK